MLRFHLLKKNTLVCVLFFCATFFCNTEGFGSGLGYFKMTDSLLKAQEMMYQFRFVEAQKVVDNQRKNELHNLAIDWLDEQLLFMQLVVTEDRQLYENKQFLWGQLFNRIQKKKINNAWYRMVLSDCYVHRGLVKIRFNELSSAASDFKSANKLLIENKTMFPSFLPDNKNSGLLQCLFSSVPEKYQFFAKILGFEGQMESGLKEMEDYIYSPLNYKEHVWLKFETVFAYALIQHHLHKNSQAAFETIDEYSKRMPNTIFVNYAKATLAGYAGKNDLVVNYLSVKYPFQYQPFYYTYYLLGLAKLRQLDMGAADYFEAYIKHYKGNNLKKSALRYLNWIAVLEGQSKVAQQYYGRCIKEGNALSEEDKQAQREAQEGLLWPVKLLQIRLSFDGKYYDKAWKLWQQVEVQQLGHVKHKLEYNYRKARLLQETNQSTNAIKQYLLVVQEGKNLPYYYAAYSSVFIAQLYEERKDIKAAQLYYLKAKNEFKANQEYTQTINQKAKAGLKRLQR